MLWLEGCPRCGTGDVRESRDVYGGYVLCVQCGYYLTDSQVQELRQAHSRGVAASAGGRERPAA